ncbi:hypothetical protein Tco_1177900 [Tanacetum coccineum]|uniref:Uncharacterized protein n=1 Tax=Tanacetum coccineum TaxID=301880 RepID=A0ABQ5C3N0_9ASTR
MRFLVLMAANVVVTICTFLALMVPFLLTGPSILILFQNDGKKLNAHHTSIRKRIPDDNLSISALTSRQAVKEKAAALVESDWDVYSEHVVKHIHRIPREGVEALAKKFDEKLNEKDDHEIDEYYDELEGRLLMAMHVIRWTKNESFSKICSGHDINEATLRYLVDLFIAFRKSVLEKASITVFYYYLISFTTAEAVRKSPADGAKPKPK